MKNENDTEARNKIVADLRSEELRQGREITMLANEGVSAQGLGLVVDDIIFAPVIGAKTLATGKNQYNEDASGLADQGFAIAAFIPFGKSIGTGEKVIVEGLEHADELGRVVVKGEIHHIASDKAIKSGYTEQFETIFNNAGMTLDDAANKVFLENHSGGHTVKYKEYVLDKLENATRGLSGDDANKALNHVLNDLKTELTNNPRMPYKDGIK